MPDHITPPAGTPGKAKSATRRAKADILGSRAGHANFTANYAPRCRLPPPKALCTRAVEFWAAGGGRAAGTMFR